MSSLGSTVDIVEMLRQMHGDDQSQIDVILSDQNIIVEAPAGYGKTKTMVSRIAYFIASKQFSPPKKILVLSYSVNAALKIKRDVISQLPALLSSRGLDSFLLRMITISNYHGFCRNLLRAHGHHLNNNFNQLESFKVVEEKDIDKQVNDRDRFFLKEFDKRLKDGDIKYVFENNRDYSKILLADLVPQKIITYNGLLSITIDLLNNNKKMVDFYHELFRAIFVDEIQDTNALALWLISLLNRGDQQISLFGDPTQQIYQFIGALPEVMNICKKRFNLEAMYLDRSHRFQANNKMSVLERNIRANYKDLIKPVIDHDAHLELHWFKSQIDESSWITKMAQELSESSLTATAAILVRQRGPNTDQIVNKFDELLIPFFYGLFSDDSSIYIQFHDDCLQNLIDLEQDIQDYQSLGTKFAESHQQRMAKLYANNTRREFGSFLALLSVFWKDLINEKRHWDKPTKQDYVHQIFANYGLKQFVGKVGSKITLCTVHAAKGLEWDYVILPDMEQYLFPHSSVCSKCPHQRNCGYDVQAIKKNDLLSEINLFYVGCTRAKVDVQFSGSSMQSKDLTLARKVNPSCLFSMPGVQTKIYTYDI